MTPTNKPAAGDARLRRLFWLRNVSIAGQVLAIAVAQAAFSVELPVAELALVVGLLSRRTRARPGASPARNRRATTRCSANSSSM
jgi:hypothetical protein